MENKVTNVKLGFNEGIKQGMKNIEIKVKVGKGFVLGAFLGMWLKTNFLFLKELSKRIG